MDSKTWPHGTGGDHKRPPPIGAAELLVRGSPCTAQGHGVGGGTDLGHHCARGPVMDLGDGVGRGLPVRHGEGILLSCRQS